MNRILLFGIVLIAIAVAGCSSPAANTSNTGSSNTVSSTGTQVGGNSEVQPQTAATVPVGPEIATTASPLTTKKKLVDADPDAPIKEGQRMPASENSEIATTMDKAGNFIEIRYFKSHPQLIKVQRTWLGPGKSTLKIWLKNGKVVDAVGDSIENMANVSIATLLGLAGIKVPDGTGAK